MDNPIINHQPVRQSIEITIHQSLTLKNPSKTINKSRKDPLQTIKNPLRIHKKTIKPIQNPLKTIKNP